MVDYKLHTPVALIIFNRPEHSSRVFSEIAKAKPPKLLIIGDGPRTGRPGEEDKVKAARSIVNSVNWDCEVLVDFSDINLGCKKRVSSGISWVFENVDESIILEDDCLPDQTFFRYCQELLELYRDDKRISMIGGTNIVDDYSRNDDSYRFSRSTPIWGWATWRNRWQDSYDVDMKHWPRIRDEGWITDMVRNTIELENIIEAYNNLYHGKIDTWDGQWTFASLLHGRLSIVPCNNLISNIGFGEDATHTTQNDAVLANLAVKSMKFPLVHPIGIIESHEYDIKVSLKTSERPSLLKRTISRFTRPMLRQRLKAKLIRALKLSRV